MSASCQEFLGSSMPGRLISVDKPASNVKLVTTLAALKYLGPNYKFKTKIYTDGSIQNGVLNGNLYVKGFGDPKLVSEQLWYISNN